MRPPWRLRVRRRLAGDTSIGGALSGTRGIPDYRHGNPAGQARFTTIAVGVCHPSAWEMVKWSVSSRPPSSVSCRRAGSWPVRRESSRHASWRTASPVRPGNYCAVPVSHPRRIRLWDGVFRDGYIHNCNCRVWGRPAGSYRILYDMLPCRSRGQKARKLFLLLHCACSAKQSTGAVAGNSVACSSPGAQRRRKRREPLGRWVTCGPHR